MTTPAFTIAAARTAGDYAVVADLLAAYVASLPITLDYQDFDAEFAGLPGKYAPPTGDLLIARDTEGRPLGCVGLRPIALAGCCEMKRLFLTPAARGLGIGRALAQAMIETARALGYRELYLDTLASMTAAQALYASIGFRRIEPYYEPTPDGTVFMSLTP